MSWSPGRSRLLRAGRVRVGGNPDASLRALEREAQQGDPEALQTWFRRRQRAGGRDALRAVSDERSWIYDTERPRIEAAWAAESSVIDGDAMKALRKLHPRIKRSKRKDLFSLSNWAETVAIQEGEKALREGDEDAAAYWTDAVQETLQPFMNHGAERNAFWKDQARALMERYRELVKVRLQVARSADPRPGNEEVMFRFHSTSTHSSVGYGADGYAKGGAEGDVAFLKHLGFEAWTKRVEGEPWGPGGPPRSPFIRGAGAYSWIRPGQGWESYVSVESPEDAEILRAQQDAMKELDWEGYMNIVIPFRRQTP